MKNIEFERNYEMSPEEKAHSAKIFEQIYAPGGFLEEFSRQMDAIPKVIVPEDAVHYEELLQLCDRFACKHHGRIHGVVDYRHWDAHIDLILPLVEFEDEEDLHLLKEIGEKAHYFCVSAREDGDFHVYVMINYFKELACEEYLDFLKYQILSADEALSSLYAGSRLSEEDQAAAMRIRDLLARFECETSLDRTTAFRTAVNRLLQGEPAGVTAVQVEAQLEELLEHTLDEERGS